jgi:hypothetical protein
MITFSPSRSIAVSCFISMTSSWPRRFALASSHALFSSAAHGAMSFPSTTSRRCLALSMQEIFSTALFPLANKARQEPNSRNGKSLNFQETDARTRMIGVEEVKTVKTVEAKRRVSLRGMPGGLQIKHIASHRSQISSFVQATSCGSLPGKRQHHRHLRHAPYMRRAPL